MRFAKVIVDRTAAELDRVFDYRIPACMTQICPGYRVRVPFAGRQVEGFVVEITTHSDLAPHKLKEVLSTVEEYPALTPDLLTLAQWVCQTYGCFYAEALRLMLPAQMRTGSVHAKEERIVTLAVSAAHIGREMATMRGKNQLATLNALLSAQGTLPMGVLQRDYGVQSGTVKVLEQKGLVQITAREQLRTPAAMQEVSRDVPLQMDPAQQNAVAKVCAALGTGGTFLLHGVTGSGKTEVYMQCAAQTLMRGQSVLILVPEIALTPQMTARFVARFGAQAAVLHSRLSPGERFDEWRRIRRGDARVVVGARSAVFAPLQNLGLVVIDEEHETSYQSENMPRYRAHEVAAQRCAMAHAPLLLGSATPAITTYYAAQQGAYTLLELPKRVQGRAMPRVEVVDMRKELRQGNRSVLSSALQEALRDTLQKGEQAMLLLNRRGYATFVSCRSCGEPVRCEFCDVSMTYHKATDMLQCHYCGATRAVPQVCPACQSRAIRYFGDGTQKLQEELQVLFPQARTLRMDADTTRGKDGHARLLEEFRRGEAQILLGTQMIAKGLDFPNVTLVGVVAVDSMLFMSDYRSCERAYQLMEQVSGRAGRAQKQGRAILQTYDPDHVAVQCAAQHRYHDFYLQELQTRRDAQFPPFGYVLRVLVSHEDSATAQEYATRLHAEMQAMYRAAPDIAAEVLFTQTVAAPLPRLQGRYRFQLVVKCRAGMAVTQLEQWAFAQARKAPQGLYCSVERDPLSML